MLVNVFVKNMLMKNHTQSSDIIDNILLNVRGWC